MAVGGNIDSLSKSCSFISVLKRIKTLSIVIFLYFPTFMKLASITKKQTNLYFFLPGRSSVVSQKRACLMAFCTRSC